MSARILVVDNYDSFVFNLVQYLYQLGAECEVLRNDEVELSHAQDGFDGVLLSPGPGTPEQAGCLHRHGPALRGHGRARLRRLPRHAVDGGRVRRRRRPGPRAAARQDLPVTHEGKGVFAGLPSPFTATRYHSLAAEPAALPAELEVTARTEDGIIMGLRHRELPVEGVQFHPESVLTEHGHLMLANWLEQCGDKGAVGRSAGLAPVVGKAVA